MATCWGNQPSVATWKFENEDFRAIKRMNFPNIHGLDIYFQISHYVCNQWSIDGQQNGNLIYELGCVDFRGFPVAFRCFTGFWGS